MISEGVTDFEQIIIKKLVSTHCNYGEMLSSHRECYRVTRSPLDVASPRTCCVVPDLGHTCGLSQ
jgi:hypothetical protein